jgi:hypothetical protein
LPGEEVLDPLLRLLDPHPLADATPLPVAAA